VSVESGAGSSEDQHCRDALAAGGIGTWEWNLATGHVRWSGEMFRLLGLDPGTAVAGEKVLLAVVAPDDRDRVAAHLAEFRTRPGLLRLEFRLLGIAGEPRWLVLLGRTLADAAGAPARMLGVAIDGTSRRRGEQATRHGAERLRLAMKSGRLGEWEYDFAARTVRWGPDAAAMHGLAPEDIELTPAGWLRLVHPTDRLAVRRAYRAALAAPGDYSVEYRLAGDAKRAVSVQGTVLRGPDRRPERALGVMADISERRQAEQALRESEQRLKLATEAAGIGIWDWNLLDNSIEYSEQAKTICGFPPGEPVTMDMVRGVTHPDDLPRTQPLVRRATDPAIRDTPVYEYRLLLPGGRVRWVTAYGRAIFAKVGGRVRAVRYLGTIQDITERKQAEQMLRDSEARLRLALDAGRMAVWEHQAASDRLIGSPELNRLFGFAEDAVADIAEMRARYAPGERERLAGAAQAALARGDRFFEAEVGYVWPDSSEHWLQIRAEFILKDGVPDRTIGVAMDITARRRMEAALRESEARLRVLNEELEARVRAEVAAREAAQARVAHAERMLALGQLAGGIAHDFNNVLQVVQGAAALIGQRAQDSAAVARLAGMILDASSRGASVTRRLLAFARHGDLRAEPIDVAALLEGIREVLGSALGAAIQVRVEVPAGVPPLFADKSQLETALVNLATNARDAMPRGGTLRLAAEAETVAEDGGPHNKPPLAPGAYVRLVVSDSGQGMEPALLKRAVEPFFTTKPIGQGTGLGLPMVKGFAEQSGGALEIESAPGRGTTVSLWLPQARAPKEPVPPMGRDGFAFAGGPSRVLLVDDEPLVREVTAAQLEQLGFAVLVAGSGEEALALLRAGERVDALVSDLSMPGMDGLALIRAAQAERGKLASVLLTGFAGDGAALAIDGAAGGEVSLMRKPVSGEQLADRLAALLQPAPAKV
jgi:PAS domain S-box-containing protein